MSKEKPDEMKMDDGYGNDMELVRISDVEGFGDWLYGQTIPYVTSDNTPMDWAYKWDYARFMRNGAIID